MAHWLAEVSVLRGRWNSEPAVTVRDPAATVRPADLVELQDRRLKSGWEAARARRPRSAVPGGVVRYRASRGRLHEASSRVPGAGPEEARLFTGIVEDLGEVQAVEQFGDFARIHVLSTVVTSDAHLGDSICVNGVCLTVTALLGSGLPSTVPAPGDDSGKYGGVVPPDDRASLSNAPIGFVADVMGETLARSSLKTVAPGTRVNLERSVRLADRLGGHLVQGHVDGTATIIGRDPQEQWEVVRISLPPDLARYVVHKGSVTVDGVSLTVSALSPGGTTPWFEVSLIPETLKRTTLGLKQPGAEVNLEVDVIAKYVEKLVGGTR